MTPTPAEIAAARAAVEHAEDHMFSRKRAKMPYMTQMKRIRKLRAKLHRLLQKQEKIMDAERKDKV